MVSTARQLQYAAPKLVKKRQNFPFDPLVNLCQLIQMISQKYSQFSHARVTSITGGAANEKILIINAREVLDGLVALPIQTRPCTIATAEVRHLGAGAQDFRSACGLGADVKSTKAMAADGVVLVTVHGLKQKVKHQLKTQESHLGRSGDRLAVLEKLTFSAAYK